MPAATGPGTRSSGTPERSASRTNRPTRLWLSRNGTPASTRRSARSVARSEASRAARIRSDLADLLVEAGVPFRESHSLVGRLVREAERAGVPLDRVPPAVAAGIHPSLGAALSQLGTWEASVEGRATPGGASRKSVQDQLEELRKLFAPGGGA